LGQFTLGINQQEDIWPPTHKVVAKYTQRINKVLGQDFR